MEVLYCSFLVERVLLYICRRSLLLISLLLDSDDRVGGNMKRERNSTDDGTNEISQSERTLYRLSESEWRKSVQWGSNLYVSWRATSVPKDLPSPAMFLSCFRGIRLSVITSTSKFHNWLLNENSQGNLCCLCPPPSLLSQGRPMTHSRSPTLLFFRLTTIDDDGTLCVWNPPCGEREREREKTIP